MDGDDFSQFLNVLENIKNETKSKFDDMCLAFEFGIPLFVTLSDLPLYVLHEEEKSIFKQKLRAQTIQILFRKTTSLSIGTYFNTLYGLYAPARMTTRLIAENLTTMSVLYEEDEKHAVEWFNDKENQKYRTTSFANMQIKLFQTNPDLLNSHISFKNLLNEHSHTSLKEGMADYFFSERLSEDLLKTNLNLIYESSTVFTDLFADKWHENPKFRKTFPKLEKQIKKALPEGKMDFGPKREIKLWNNSK